MKKSSSRIQIEKIMVWVLMGSFFLTAENLWASQGDLPQLAERLIELRSEVESLHSEVESLKTEIKNKVGSQMIQRGDLETNIQRDTIRKKVLMKKISERRNLLLKKTSNQQDMKPQLLTYIDSLESYVQVSLPYKHQERLADLKKLKSDIETGLMRPYQALSRLWVLFSDEIKLSNENSISRQTAVVDGDELLVDVVKLGMVMMYFKTSDQKVGYAKKSGGAWKYEYIESGSERKQILAVFDAVKKQIRSGEFTLPHELSVQGVVE